MTAIGAVGSAAAAENEVTNLQAIANHPDGVRLTWQYDGDPVTHFEIEANGEVLEKTEFTTIELTGLQPDTTYTFAVTPVTESGASSYGATLELTTEPFCELNSNSFTVEEAGPNSLTINWESCDPSFSIRDHWQVYVDNEAYTTVPAGQTQATIDGLDPGTSYDVEIQPVAADGTKGPRDDFSSAETKIKNTPKNLQAIANHPDGVRLAWGYDGDPVTHFEIKANGEVLKKTEFSTIELTGLQPDTDYTFAVTPVTESGAASAKATVELTTEPFCELNSNSFTVKDAGPKWITINWESCDPALSTRDHWQVYVDDEAHTTVPAGQTEATIEGLEPDTSYDVEIQPVAADGTKGPRDDFSSAKTTPPDTQVPAPANLQVDSKTKSSATVSWDGVTDDKSGLKQYAVYVDGNQETTVSAGDQSATVEGLSAGGHTIEVTAIDNAGNESDPAAVEVTIQAKANIGVDLSSSEITSGESTTGTVTLAEAPNGVSGYQITVSVSDTSVATIESASVSDPFSNPSDLSVPDDGSSVSIKGADLSGKVSPGETDVALATVELQAQSEGSASVDVTVENVDGNDGQSLTTTTQPATLTVAPKPVVPVDGSMPTDPDGDGLYEDLNGNGELDYADVTQYFEHMGDPAMTNHSDAYDYNGNGEIDFADLVDLFEQV